MEYRLFGQINLADVFFDSLRQDYLGFDEWFQRKSLQGERAYVLYEKNGQLLGFLYLKIEEGEAEGVEPTLAKLRRVKIGTFKIDAHGTRLGQRFIKKMFDWALQNCADELYVTVFEKHAGLISLFERYGFMKCGTKSSLSGEEQVYLKKISNVVGDIVRDYPVINRPKRFFVLSIFPVYHTKLFPDSKVATEAPSVIEDLSHTNSIHKIYLCNMRGVENLQPNDVIVIYRTKDGGPAYYTSVATSICVVEEIKSIYDFRSEQEFLDYALPYSVFDAAELKELWQRKKYPKIVRFSYNVSLNRRPNLKALIEDVGIDGAQYLGFFPLSRRQFDRIRGLGLVNESIVVD